MAHTHERPVVVEQRSGMSAAVAVLAIAVVVFLVWLFAFSGWVFDRDTGTGQNDDVRIEQEFRGGGGG